MIVVAKEDVLRGLKKFKRLAKQDLLISRFTPEPHFWEKQAEGRRNTYDRLTKLIFDHGVDHAYKSALKLYVDLPFSFENKIEDAEVIGMKQALEMFFTIVGMQPPLKKNFPTLVSSLKYKTQDQKIVLNAK